MSLAGEEEKETCTGKRLRSHDSTTAWGSSSSDAADAAGETERTLTKHARRRPAGAQAAEMEPAQKKRLREGKLKEDEQEKSVKQKLEGDSDPANPHNPQPPDSPPPGATAYYTRELNIKSIAPRMEARPGLPASPWPPRATHRHPACTCGHREGCPRHPVR